jgi:hypothetical protein
VCAGYEPPNRYTVARRLKRLHIFHRKKLIDDLTFIDHISITLDFWSNRQMRSFLVITGHYFGVNNFTLQSTVLHFSTFDKQHKATEITQILQATLKELKILHKIFRVTADGARNMVRAIDDSDLNLKRVWCVAHRLHLTITNAFGFWIVKKNEDEEGSEENGGAVDEEGNRKFAIFFILFNDNMIKIEGEVYTLVTTEKYIYHSDYLDFHHKNLTINKVFFFFLMDTHYFELSKLYFSCLFRRLDVIKNVLDDQDEEEMIDVEKFQINNEPDEISMDFTNDFELADDNDNDNNNELIEDDHVSDEELLSSSDIVDDEIMDNWTEDVYESDYDDKIIHDQDMIICRLIKKCRGLVLMIKRSTIITLFFDTERKKLNIKRNLCYDVKSRWNSTYSMIDSFLVLREIIEKLFNHKHNLHLKPNKFKKLTGFELTVDDWIMLSALRLVLKPFFHATKVMSGHHYPSIGLAFYLLVHLKIFLQQQQDKNENIMIKRLKQLLLSQFIYYFESDNEQVELLKVESQL